MAEEQRCEEGNRLCANNCASSAKIAAEKPLIDPSSASASSSSPPSVASSPSFPQSEPSDSVRATVVAPPAAVAAQEGSAQLRSRCGSCRKRVGLVGFRCRCGSTYCGAHRYPEKHQCTFDFKSAGREAIARANPIVKADKLAGRI